MTAASPRPVPENALVIEGLTKVYKGGKVALSDVSLTIPQGAMVGLLGPNGAGKSTLINIMAGLVRKTRGRVVIWGNDLDKDERNARCAIGVVPQELNLDPFFTPRELLSVQAGLYGVPRAERKTEEILEAVGLADKADSYARSLSGGMRRRLLVAKAMVHQPPVLILDEPTAGVDVALRQQLWTMIRALNARGTTILLTTHYLEEAEDLCDRIAIINQGRLVTCEPTATLLRRVDSKAVTLTLAAPVAAVPGPLAALGAELRGPTTLVVTYQPSTTPMGRILAAVQDAGLAVADMATHEADLEDIFLRLTATSESPAA
ncbi:ABC transporter ATP-binding protein [Pararhodospirillum oryzae]|uniref:Multidrug ABC transporter ATP-binding protein n=1 Tax=Pararhodospirillum oryzae TaxID=478448 RepID=A0A512H6G4_9PROT|nr:ABC transporter ATP-binding protein [Pararhodospirillum oryzae]GEO80980.1 multidrug ABC transporter ATP-binding protein [Pararhodospirillum oryzae]